MTPRGSRVGLGPRLRRRDCGVGACGGDVLAAVGGLQLETVGVEKWSSSRVSDGVAWMAYGDEEAMSGVAGLM